MLAIEQLQMFQVSREERIEQEVEQLKKQSEKVRKSLFARNNELMELYCELQDNFIEVRTELDALKEFLSKIA